MQRILVNICCTTSCCPMSLCDNCTGLLCFLMPCSLASNEFLSLFHYIPPWYQFKCIFSLTQLRPLLALWGFVTSMYVTVYMTVYELYMIWYLSIGASSPRNVLFVSTVPPLSNRMDHPGITTPRPLSASLARLISLYVAFVCIYDWLGDSTSRPLWASLVRLKWCV